MWGGWLGGCAWEEGGGSCFVRGSILLPGQALRRCCGYVSLFSLNPKVGLRMICTESGVEDLFTEKGFSGWISGSFQRGDLRVIAMGVGLRRLR